jgi:hypothetical protein
MTEDLSFLIGYFMQERSCHPICQIDTAMGSEATDIVAASIFICQFGCCIMAVNTTARGLKSFMMLQRGFQGDI